jgi:flagellar biosynthesis regulator FlbT
MKDLNFFLRKIESLSGSVVSMQNVLETLTGMKQENQIELNSFMTQESFSKFNKIYQNDKKGLERSIEEFRRVINEFTEIVKYKAGENDLKNFEALVMNKIEELKINCGKKFADKIDTSKSLKYLDAQIKYISEIFVKRVDKSDSWLLAKKPVGGFSCASCESYIGELKSKGDYVAWNKYPQREKTYDKNYRVGNGFSRMLKMLNIDLKNSGDLNMNNSFESDDDELDQNQHINQNSNNNINLNLSRGLRTSASYKNRSSLKKNIKSLNNIFSQNNLLPKINSIDGIINSESLMENFSDNKTNESPKKTITINEGNKVNESADKKPHIVKVFRKNK